MVNQKDIMSGILEDMLKQDFPNHLNCEDIPNMKGNDNSRVNNGFDTDGNDVPFPDIKMIVKMSNGSITTFEAGLESLITKAGMLFLMNSLLDNLMIDNIELRPLEE